MSKSGNLPHDHQDWNTVVISKPKTEEEKKKLTTTTVPKHTGPNSNKTAATKKLEESTDAQPLPTVSHDLSKQIQQARMAKKLTQKELAQKLNEPVATIQQYENGKAVPNGQLLAKMSKELGVTLKKNNNKQKK